MYVYTYILVYVYTHMYTHTHAHTHSLSLSLSLSLSHTHTHTQDLKSGVRTWARCSMMPTGAAESVAPTNLKAPKNLDSKWAARSSKHTPMYNKHTHTHTQTDTHTHAS
jgi:hypothetical protein